MNVSWKVSAMVIAWILLFIFGGGYGAEILNNHLGPNDPLFFRFWSASVLLPIILLGVAIEWILIRCDIAKNEKTIRQKNPILQNATR